MRIRTLVIPAGVRAAGLGGPGGAHAQHIDVGPGRSATRRHACRQPLPHPPPLPSRRIPVGIAD